MPDPQQAVPISLDGPGALRPLQGIPLAEYADGRLGPCLRCGRLPDLTQSGLLLNMTSDEGVLVADTLCADCMSPDEFDRYLRVRDEE